MVQKITAAESRDTIKEPELIQFSKSELHELKLLDEVLAEYEQIGGYMETIFELSSQLTTATAGDASDLEKFYTTFSDAIQVALDALNAAKPPSFLQSFHEDMIKAITDLHSATEYLVASISINDPLRLDAGMYRFSVIMRDVSAMMKSTADDIDRRKAKIMQEFDTMKKTQEGLNALAAKEHRPV